MKKPVSVRCTEVGDARATWCRSQQSIRILQVHKAAGALLIATGPATAPDLANMREWFPELTPLWDAVRHQFWSHAAWVDSAG